MIKMNKEKILIDLQPINPKNVIGLPDGRLYLSKKSLSHIMALLYAMNGKEFGFKMIGERRSSTCIKVSDVFIPTQIVSGGYFETLDEGYVEIANLSRKINPNSIIGWAHSHAYMSPFHSGVDVKTDFSHVALSKLPIASLTIGNALTDWDARIYVKLKQKKFTYINARIIFAYDVAKELKKIVEIERPKTRIIFEKAKESIQIPLVEEIKEEELKTEGEEVPLKEKKPWWKKWL